MSVARPSSEDALCFSQGLREGCCGCRETFGSTDIETARKARLPAEQDSPLKGAIGRSGQHGALAGSGGWTGRVLAS